MRQKIREKKPMDRVAVALVLCFSVVALASVFTVKSSLDKINLSDNSGMNLSDTQEDKLVTKRVPTVDSKDNANSNSSEKSGEASASAQWIAPVAGSVTVKYSTEMPIYSPTLSQYMVHNGIDISAALDSRVQAACGGTVVETFKDDKLGETIKINHGNGFITTYSNLAPNVSVEVGDVVKQGDILGSIGDTGLFESAQESHLHFEMEKDGALVNPEEFLKL